MKKPLPHVCPTCHDTGVVIRPRPKGQSWAHRCPACGDVYFTAAHVSKLYRRYERLGGFDVDVWLGCLHREVAGEVRVMVRRETAVQLALFS